MAALSSLGGGGSGSCQPQEKKEEPPSRIVTRLYYPLKSLPMPEVYHLSIGSRLNCLRPPFNRRSEPLR